MKKLFLFTVILTVGVFSKVQAQSLKNDCDFFKSTTFTYHALSLFDEAKKDGKATPQLKKDVDKINAVYKSLETKYPNDADFKTYTMWVEVINKSYSLLKEGDSTWQLAYSLLKLDLEEFINEKY